MPEAGARGEAGAEVQMRGREQLTSGFGPFKIRRNLAVVLMMSLSFFFIFTATQTCQVLLAILIGDLGLIMTGLSYGCFALAGFVAPAISRGLGPKKGLLIGAVFYVTYVCSLIYLVTPVLLVASAFIGLGASVLWTSQARIWQPVAARLGFRYYTG